MPTLRHFETFSYFACVYMTEIIHYTRWKLFSFTISVCTYIVFYRVSSNKAITILPDKYLSYCSMYTRRKSSGTQYMGFGKAIFDTCNVIHTCSNLNLPQDPLQHALTSLAAMDRKVIPIIGDGNCLFRALSFVLYGNETCHKNVRELLVQFISQNQANFKPYICGDLETYLDKMKCTGVWGTSVELLAAASFLCIPVFTLIPHTSTYKWLKYKPLCEDMLTFPSQNPPSKQLLELNHIELLNVQGCHYDCIVSLDGSYPMDEPPLNEFVELHIVD